MNKKSNTCYRNFDNFNITDLKYILNEDTTLKRYYPLIVQKDEIIKKLTASGVTDKYSYLSLCDEELNKKTGISIEDIQLLRTLFHLHDFIDRKLSQITTIDNNFIEQLIKDGIKTSFQYINLCIDEGID